MKRFATIFILSCVAIAGAPAGILAQSAAQPATPATASVMNGAVELRPKFIPGEVLRYQMELVTTTEGSSGGVVQDPQGPSRLVVTWDATVRIEVLPAEVSPSTSVTPSAQSAASAAALHLRMTYEKSAATIQTDGFDPTASAIQDQYQRLQGHAVDFSLDAEGKVTDISGGDDVFATPQAARDAQAWVAQLSSGFAPPGTASVPGQQWSSDEPATGIPLPDMFWHTDSNYLRNESCALGAPPQTAAPSAPGASSSPGSAAPPGAQSLQSPQSTSAGSPATPSAGAGGSGESCAVINTRVSLVPTKATQKAEDQAAKNSAAQSSPNSAAPGTVPKGLHATGTWTGESESVIYVSLRTGWVVSIAQNGDEQMDVTVVSDRLDSMRYAGKVHSHVDLRLLAQ